MKKTSVMSYCVCIVLPFIFASGCGSSSGDAGNTTENTDQSSDATITVYGKAIDGYIAGGEVCVAQHENTLVCDDTYPTALTDETGGYSIELPQSILSSAILIVKRGIDKDTNASFEGILKAPVFDTTANHITPLTTLAANVKEEEPDLEPSQALTRVAVMSGFGTSEVVQDYIAEGNNELRQFAYGVNLVAESAAHILKTDDAQVNTYEAVDAMYKNWTTTTLQNLKNSELSSDVFNASKMAETLNTVVSTSSESAFETLATEMNSYASQPLNTEELLVEANNKTLFLNKLVATTSTQLSGGPTSNNANNSQAGSASINNANNNNEDDEFIVEQVQQQSAKVSEPLLKKNTYTKDTAEFFANSAAATANIVGQAFNLAGNSTVSTDIYNVSTSLSSVKTIIQSFGSMDAAETGLESLAFFASGGTSLVFMSLNIISTILQSGQTDPTQTMLEDIDSKLDNISKQLTSLGNKIDALAYQSRQFYNSFQAFEDTFTIHDNLESLDYAVNGSVSATTSLSIIRDLFAPLEKIENSYINETFLNVYDKDKNQTDEVRAKAFANELNSIMKNSGITNSEVEEHLLTLFDNLKESQINTLISTLYNNLTYTYVNSDHRFFGPELMRTLMLAHGFGEEGAIRPENIRKVMEAIYSDYQSFFKQYTDALNYAYLYKKKYIETVEYSGYYRDKYITGTLDLNCTKHKDGTWTDYCQEMNATNIQLVEHQLNPKVLNTKEFAALQSKIVEKIAVSDGGTLGYFKAMELIIQSFKAGVDDLLHMDPQSYFYPKHATINADVIVQSSNEYIQRLLGIQKAIFVDFTHPYYSDSQEEKPSLSDLKNMGLEIIVNDNKEPLYQHMAFEVPVFTYNNQKLKINLIPEWGTDYNAIYEAGNVPPFYTDGQYAGNRNFFEFFSPVTYKSALLKGTTYKTDTVGDIGKEIASKQIYYPRLSMLINLDTLLEDNITSYTKDGMMELDLQIKPIKSGSTNFNSKASVALWKSYMPYHPYFTETYAARMYYKHYLQSDTFISDTVEYRKLRGDGLFFTACNNEQKWYGMPITADSEHDGYTIQEANISIVLNNDWLNKQSDKKFTLLDAAKKDIHKFDGFVGVDAAFDDSGNTARFVLLVKWGKRMFATSPENAPNQPKNSYDNAWLGDDMAYNDQGSKDTYNSYEYNKYLCRTFRLDNAKDAALGIKINYGGIVASKEHPNPVGSGDRHHFVDEGDTYMITTSAFQGKNYKSIRKYYDYEENKKLLDDDFLNYKDDYHKDDDGRVCVQSHKSNECVPFKIYDHQYTLFLSNVRAINQSITQRSVFDVDRYYSEMVYRYLTSTAYVSWIADSEKSSVSDEENAFFKFYLSEFGYNISDEIMQEVTDKISEYINHYYINWWDFESFESKEAAFAEAQSSIKNLLMPPNAVNKYNFTVQEYTPAITKKDGNEIMPYTFYDAAQRCNAIGGTLPNLPDIVDHLGEVGKDEKTIKINDSNQSYYIDKDTFYETLNEERATTHKETDPVKYPFPMYDATYATVDVKDGGTTNNNSYIYVSDEGNAKGYIAIEDKIVKNYKSFVNTIKTAVEKKRQLTYNKNYIDFANSNEEYIYEKDIAFFALASDEGFMKKNILDQDVNLRNFNVVKVRLTADSDYKELVIEPNKYYQYKDTRYYSNTYFNPRAKSATADTIVCQQ